MPERVLSIINEGLYGNERPYNALRLALEPLKLAELAVQIFLFGDGTQCAQAG